MEETIIMRLNARLVERTTKTGNKYKCAVVTIAPGVETMVFLKPAELKLLEVYSSNSNTPFIPESDEELAD